MKRRKIKIKGQGQNVLKTYYSQQSVLKELGYIHFNSNENFVPHFN